MELTMKLNSLPFEMIESGRKTIELRLYDEKRRKISVGDTIRFVLVDDESKELKATVKELYIFSSFEELYKTLPLTECGYTADTVKHASPKDMQEYYTSEQEKKYGVLGIKIEVIADT